MEPFFIRLESNRTSIDEFPYVGEVFNLRLEGEAKLLKHGQRTLNWEIEARRSEDSMVYGKGFNLISF